MGDRSRSEPRQELVRMVECRRPQRGLRSDTFFGFTRNLSDSGLCLGIDRPEPVGTELQISVQELGGRVGRRKRARVVWCRGGRDGRFWIGLELTGGPGAGRRPALGDTRPVHANF